MSLCNDINRSFVHEILLLLLFEGTVVYRSCKSDTRISNNSQGLKQAFFWGVGVGGGRNLYMGYKYCLIADSLSLGQKCKIRFFDLIQITSKREKG